MRHQQSLKLRYNSFKVEFSEEKNLLLKETRHLGFDDVLAAIEKNKILDDLKNKQQKYLYQRILVVEIKKYAYAIPYVIDLERKVVFLKTVYPSRILTEKYLKRKEKDEN